MKKLISLICLILYLNGFSQTADFNNDITNTNKSDAYLQGFYWNSVPGGVWWDSLSSLAPALSSSGFGGIWIPSPIKGNGGGFSMGYDPYDHYDFGEYNQKGSKETRFGSRSELIRMVNSFHEVGIEVFADAVMNHMNGGEKKIAYECTPPNHPDSAYLLFDYPNGSKRFRKNASHFYPNSQTCDVNPDYHGASDPIFQFGEWIAHDRSFVRDSLIVWGNYLRKNIGFDGFRIDAVKGIDPAFMGPWLQAVNSDGYAVAEYFGGTEQIKFWLNAAKGNGGEVAMFDFPLRFALKDMCDNTTGSFDMKSLDWSGLVNSGVSGYNVSTFVENHDMDRIGWDGAGSDDPGHSPIVKDKHLAYAHIIFSEGRPCVFFKDYFEYGFKGKIDTLIWIRQNFLGGGTAKRDQLNSYFVKQDGNQDQALLSSDVYIARRNGYGDQIGGYLLINDNPSMWIDVWVDTESTVGTIYRDFTGKDADKTVVGPDPGGSGKNRMKLWVPPRSYTIYVANTSLGINHPPIVNSIPPQTAYTNSKFIFQLVYNDADGDKLNFALSDNPSWLNINDKGLISGIAPNSSVGDFEIQATVSDPGGSTASVTLFLSVKYNTAPILTAVEDLVVTATERFEFPLAAVDEQNDTLRFSLLQSPSWLKLGEFSGIISGTPSLDDIGQHQINLSVTDGKGAYDSTNFIINVLEKKDSIIATFGKPFIDGAVNIDKNDWLDDWLIIADSDTDSYWNPITPIPDNELYAVFATWDSDSLYIGIDYKINDSYNTFMLYIDAGKEGGITDFNSQNGYLGDYAKNFAFASENTIDLFIADYYINAPNLFACDTNNSLDITEKMNGKRGKNAEDLEAAISWNDIYNLGEGLIPQNVELKFVALVAGGFNWGAGDSAPDNFSVDGNKGPDSLINLTKISPDKDGDGIPDPTIFISEIAETNSFPAHFELKQNYPNPFNPSTIIQFSISHDEFTTIKIYDVLGKEIQTLVSEFKKAGAYKIEFSGNINDQQLSSGVYFYKLNSGKFSVVKKMVLIR
ncbi:MAG: putative Ig domain-containing protein [Bacteroidota bacterium]